VTTSREPRDPLGGELRGRQGEKARIMKEISLFGKFFWGEKEKKKEKESGFN